MQAGQGFTIDRRAGSSGKWIDSIDLIGSMEKKKPPRRAAAFLNVVD
jgi:hypothetical protein